MDWRMGHVGGSRGGHMGASPAGRSSADRVGGSRGGHVGPHPLDGAAQVAWEGHVGFTWGLTRWTEQRGSFHAEHGQQYDYAPKGCITNGQCARSPRAVCGLALVV
eukprot:6269792-Prymnesium_polylepis.1